MKYLILAILIFPVSVNSAVIIPCDTDTECETLNPEL
jgi:hypothetical protein